MGVKSETRLSGLEGGTVYGVIRRVHDVQAVMDYGKA